MKYRAVIFYVVFILYKLNLLLNIPLIHLHILAVELLMAVSFWPASSK